MSLQASVIMLGVKDVERAKKFYTEGMGGQITRTWRSTHGRQMQTAAAAGGTVVRPAAAVDWGYFGYFSDPDGYLWKVVTDA